MPESSITSCSPLQSMKHTSFDFFFDGEVRRHLYAALSLALAEDGPDLTSLAVFTPKDTLSAYIIAKSDAVVAGLPLAPLVMQEAVPESESLPCTCELLVNDGDRVSPGTVIARMTGGARRILKAERVMLNFICHLSGIATLTAKYVEALKGTNVTLLDTRKTLPGLRYPEKYAVLAGGGVNHRRNLAEMLMLKDNHIDQAGSITEAVKRLRDAYNPCPPIEAECRTLAEVREAVACRVDRLMLDNMGPEEIAQALPLIPAGIETEISGGVSLESIRQLALAGPCRPTFISVGRLTHSAPAADFSMRIAQTL